MYAEDMALRSAVKPNTAGLTSGPVRTAESLAFAVRSLPRSGVPNPERPSLSVIKLIYVFGTVASLLIIRVLRAPAGIRTSTLLCEPAAAWHILVVYATTKGGVCSEKQKSS
jgi:hypothetical protein